MAKRDSSEQARRFGPMSGLFVAAAIAFIVLPSTLTLPNPSPTSQEEIAPVPPTASKINPPVSNFTSLNSGNQGNGLGEGGGGGGEPPQTSLPPLTLPPGLGQTPNAQYECVAGRQTEDPLSPTCVPFYMGDNGGATYQGVTAKEVRIVMYYDANSTINTSQGTSNPPYNTIVDLDKPPTPREHPTVSSNRAWQKFFNKRFAAYNRKVHMFVQFGSFDSGGGNTPGTQAQDAAVAYSKVKPFAIINYAGFGNGVYYNNYMAEHGVLIFGTAEGRSDEFYKQYAGQQWGYKPTLEYSAAQYANAICSSVNKRKASGMGAGTLGTARNGQPRKFGFLYTRDKAWPGTTQLALVARDLMEKQCGVVMAITQTYDTNSYSVDNGSTPDYAVNIAVAFQNEGVTTVLWPAGYETKIGQAMNEIRYYPEIIVGDDDLQASLNGTHFQDQVAWSQAWIVSSQTYDPPANDRICVQEYRSVDQDAPASDVNSFACDYYNDLRQLFTGIQVAGPTLTPQSIDQGFHAIPIVESTNPQVPTCYYLPGDYTCVKDSVIMHWDSTATPPSSNQPGCWRMVGNGQRFLPGKFPKVDMISLKKPNNVCNNFSTFANLALA